MSSVKIWPIEATINDPPSNYKSFCLYSAIYIDKRLYKTPCDKSGGLAPKWNHIVDFHTAKGTTFVFKIFSKHKLTPDEFIGGAQISLDSMDTPKTFGLKRFGTIVGNIRLLVKSGPASLEGGGPLEQTAGKDFSFHQEDPTIGLENQPQLKSLKRPAAMFHKHYNRFGKVYAGIETVKTKSSVSLIKPSQNLEENQANDANKVTNKYFEPVINTDMKGDVLMKGDILTKDGEAVGTGRY